VFDITPLEQHIDDAFAENRLRTILLTSFAVTAISLACIGLYGTLSYSVNVRQREIGLRLALGAVRGQIIKHFLLQGLTVTLLGCVAGWVLAAASSGLLAEMLYGVSATDITTMVSVAVLVLLVAAAASSIPAVRAARLDPMQVLREE
jgi:putative ABC transport system permease protein